MLIILLLSTIICEVAMLLREGFMDVLFVLSSKTIRNQIIDVWFAAMLTELRVLKRYNKNESFFSYVYYLYFKS